MRLKRAESGVPCSSASERAQGRCAERHERARGALWGPFQATDIRQTRLGSEMVVMKRRYPAAIGIATTVAILTGTVIAVVAQTNPGTDAPAVDTVAQGQPANAPTNPQGTGPEQSQAPSRPAYAPAASELVQVGHELLDTLTYIQDPAAPCPVPCTIDRSPIGLATRMSNICLRTDTSVARDFPTQAHPAVLALDAASKKLCTDYESKLAVAGRPDGTPNWTSAAKSWRTNYEPTFIEATKHLPAPSTAAAGAR